MQALKQHFSTEEQPVHSIDEGRSVLDAVIRSNLSQATSSQNSTHFFAVLMHAYLKWFDDLRAGPPEITDGIRISGLSDAKSRVITNIIDHACTHDEELRLQYVSKLDDDAAREELLNYPDIGPEAAARTLMFILRRPEFPIDIHVDCVTRHLGWVPSNSTATRIYDLLNHALPADAKRGLHVLFFSLGRVVCKPRAPRCSLCATGCGAVDQRKEAEA